MGQRLLALALLALAWRADAAPGVQQVNDLGRGSFVFTKTSAANAAVTFFLGDNGGPVCATTLSIYVTGANGAPSITFVDSGGSGNTVIDLGTPNLVVGGALFVVKGAPILCSFVVGQTWTLNIGAAGAGSVTVTSLTASTNKP